MYKNEIERLLPMSNQQTIKDTLTSINQLFSSNSVINMNNGVQCVNLSAIRPLIQQYATNDFISFLQQNRMPITGYSNILLELFDPKAIETSMQVPAQPVQQVPPVQTSSKVGLTGVVPLPGLAKLPNGWEETTDPNTGNTYYFNRSTGESSWERPTLSQQLASGGKSRKSHKSHKSRKSRKSRKTKSRKYNRK